MVCNILSVIIWLLMEAICFGVHLQRIYCKGEKTAEEEGIVLVAK